MAMQTEGSEKFGSGFGEGHGAGRESRKTVRILQRSPVETHAVAWTENPCVGGSIPPQATRIETPLVYSSGIVAFWGAHALKA